MGTAERSRPAAAGRFGRPGRRPAAALFKDGADGAAADPRGLPGAVRDRAPARRAATALTAGHVPPKPGEMPAVIVDTSAARALGRQPGHHLASGIATV